jgi:hypothetical protein
LSAAVAGVFDTIMKISFVVLSYVENFCDAPVSSSSLVWVCCDVGVGNRIVNRIGAAKPTTRNDTNDVTIRNCSRRCCGCCPTAPACRCLVGLPPPRRNVARSTSILIFVYFCSLFLVDRTSSPWFGLFLYFHAPLPKKSIIPFLMRYQVCSIDCI